jgi:hypothetical protein
MKSPVKSPHQKKEASMATEVHRTEICELAELERDLQHQYDRLAEVQDSFPALLVHAPKTDEAMAAMREEWEELLPTLDSLLERIVGAKREVLSRIGDILDGGP